MLWQQVWHVFQAQTCRERRRREKRGGKVGASVPAFTRHAPLKPHHLRGHVKQQRGSKKSLRTGKVSLYVSLLDVFVGYFHIVCDFTSFPLRFRSTHFSCLTNKHATFQPGATLLMNRLYSSIHASQGKYTESNCVVLFLKCTPNPPHPLTAFSFSLRPSTDSVLFQSIRHVAIDVTSRAPHSSS